MQLPRIRHLPQAALQRRVVKRPHSALRSEKSSQRISNRVKSIADDYGDEDMAAGFLKSFTDHAFDSLDQQLRDSSLPNFLQDQLRNTLKDNCTCDVSKLTATVRCRNKTDALCKEFLPLRGHRAPANIEKRVSIDNPQQPAEVKIAPLQKSWTWQRSLNIIYDRMVRNMVNNTMNSDINKKSFSWLKLLSNSLAALQVQFLQAAMDNLNTMLENTSFSHKSQQALDAMSQEDRESYIQLRNGQRRKFITAQSHYRANLLMFRQTTQMASMLFSMFSNNCRFRAS
ncbi:MAG: hypothetical protein P8163_01095 [Candidatus Thiodiazotropha sp.]